MDRIELYRDAGPHLVPTQSGPQAIKMEREIVFMDYESVPLVADRLGVATCSG